MNEIIKKALAQIDEHAKKADEHCAERVAQGRWNDEQVARVKAASAEYVRNAKAAIMDIAENADEAAIETFGRRYTGMYTLYGQSAEYCKGTADRICGRA